SWQLVFGRAAVSLLVLILPCGSHAATPARQDQPSPTPTIQDILGWLPANTETITAAVGPFETEKLADDLPNNRCPSLRQRLEASSLGPVADIGNGALFKQVRGRTVLLAVAGIRHFREPKGLGLGSSESCHILVFQRKAGPAKSEIT